MSDPTSRIRVWPAVGSERVLTTRIFAVDRHRRISPRTGSERDFYVLDSVDWCNIVALTDDEQVVMVRQYRQGTRNVTLELPGGMIDPEDPSPRRAALRELLEETGYAPITDADVTSIGAIAPNPALLNNLCHSFLAKGCRRVAELAPDDGEDIEVALVPAAEIPGRFARGEITHALVAVALTHWLGLRPPLP